MPVLLSSVGQRVPLKYLSIRRVYLEDEHRRCHRRELKCSILEVDELVRRLEVA